MRNVRIPVMLLLGISVLWATAGPTEVAADRGRERIVIEDDCDPTDPNWEEIGGCQREEGTVTRAEFFTFLLSPLADAVVGHPSWRNNPGYLVLESGERLRVRNRGGRDHTFTEVDDYGAGFIPPPPTGVDALNFGLTLGDCAGQQGSVIPPGGRIEISGLSLGNHKFQCCIHPWMRALVKVEPEDEENDDRD